MRHVFRFLRGDRAADRVVPRGVHAAVSVGFLAAVMAFFAVMALALGLAAGRLAATWNGALAQDATLQVFAPADEIEAQARAALNVLRTTPGIRSVRVVSLEEQKALLEPWLGPNVAIETLPLPLMIEVGTERDRLNRESLDLRLSAEAPGAVFDDHAAWRAPLVATARRLRGFGFACLGLTALALAAVLGLAARGAVAANAPVIQTLRLVGARDNYIARAFTRRYTLRALSGALLGTLGAAVLLALLPRASEPGFFPRRHRPARLELGARAARPARCRARRPRRRASRDPAPFAPLELIAMLLVRSLVFDISMYALLLVMGILCAPLAIWSVEGAYWSMKCYCRAVFWLLRTLCGLRVEVRGQVPAGDVIVAAKHQSFLDIMIFMRTLPRVHFVMKRELRWAPILGLYALRIGAIPVARGKRAAAMKEMVAHAEREAAGPHQLVIYPQGTRVLPGAHLPYKVGAGVLYDRLRRPCIPAATNAGVFWSRRSWYRRPGVAVVQFLAEIPAGLPVPQFMQRVEEVVEENSDRLMREAGFAITPAQAPLAR